MIDVDLLETYYHVRTSLYYVPPPPALHRGLCIPPKAYSCTPPPRTGFPHPILTLELPARLQHEPPPNHPLCSKYILEVLSL